MIQLDYDKLEILAAERGLSIREVATRLKYKNPSSIYRLRNTACLPKSAIKIAKFFKKDLDEIRVQPVETRRRKAVAR